MAFSRSGVSKVACPIRLGLIMGTFLLVVLRRSAGVVRLHRAMTATLDASPRPNHRMSSASSAIFGAGNKAEMTAAVRQTVRARTRDQTAQHHAGGCADQSDRRHDALDKPARFGERSGRQFRR